MPLVRGWQSMQLKGARCFLAVAAATGDGTGLSRKHDQKNPVRDTAKAFFIMGLKRFKFSARGIPPRSSAHSSGNVNESVAASIPPERALQVTSCLFVLGSAVASLAPPPILVARLGVESGTALLALIATASAATEMLAAPLIGAASDSIGRKPVLIGTLLLVGLVNAIVTLSPTVPVIAFSKFINSMFTGIYFLSSSAFLGDWYRTQPKVLVAASGFLLALVSVGFGLGIAVFGRLPQGLSYIYGTSSLIVFLAAAVAQFTVRESMSVAKRVPFKLRDFRPFSFLRLLRNGRQLRLLTFLSMLTLPVQPLFMGDVVQLFVEDQWSLGRKAVSDLFIAFSITSIAGNSLAGLCTRRLGIQTFTAFATISTLVTWVGFAISHQAALACIALGVMGQARTLGVTSMITTIGARQGMPQGQISGDRSNMLGVLKVLGPFLYGNLFLFGKSVGVPQMPFYLNIALCASALLLAPIALADQLGNSTKHESAS